MKLKLFFFPIFIITFTKIWSQSPPIQWQKMFGGSHDDNSREVRQTLDGGFIIAASTSSNDGDITGNHGQLDGLIIKLDALGAVQWKKAYGGPGGDIARSIQQTPDGGYIFVGSTDFQNGGVTPNFAGSDYWVVKLSPLGNIEWQKAFGGNGIDDATSIQLTTDGGYIVAGQSNSNNGHITGNHGNYDFWVVKLNSSGNMQWQKSYGGSNIEFSGKIQQTSDNGYIMVGSSLSTDGDVSANQGFRDYWVIKTDSSGNLQWQKTLGGSAGDEGFDVIQMYDGNYVVAGYSASSDKHISGANGSRDFWIVKLDVSGNTVWKKNFGGSSIDGAFSVNQTSDGGLIIGGYSQSTDGNISVSYGNLDYWIVKTDALGNLQWQKSLGGSNYDTLQSIQQTSDGGYIMTGDTRSDIGTSVNAGFFDIWVVKLGSNLGIAENENVLKPSLYPNPARDFVNIENLPRETNISITDISGRKLFSNKYSDEKVMINVSSFINGVYIVKVENKGTLILSEKLIIKK